MKNFQKLDQLFAYPFRIFFLSTGIWAIVAVILWTLHISQFFNLPFAYPALLWHQHEMLFGVVTPAIAGFLLTAVCVWTRTNRLHGRVLFLLWSIWAIGRILSILNGSDFSILSTLINLAFLPLVIIDAGRRIYSAKQIKHLVLLIVLALLWIMQLGLLVDGDSKFLDGALLTIAGLMLVIGGRIVPSFSANWLRAHGGNAACVKVIPSLEFSLMAALALLLVTVILGLSPNILAIVASVVSILCLIRLLLWSPWKVVNEPLLWVLHLSLLWIPLSLVFLSGHIFFHWPAVVWHHTLGIGAIGGLILGVMTRVSLGHTGRPLVLPPGLVTAYILIIVSMIIRVMTAFNFLPWQPGIMSAAFAWCAAFVIFLWRYSPILSSKRIDGLEG